MLAAHFRAQEAPKQTPCTSQHYATLLQQQVSTMQPLLQLQGAVVGETLAPPQKHGPVSDLTISTPLSPGPGPAPAGLHQQSFWTRSASQFSGTSQAPRIGSRRYHAPGSRRQVLCQSHLGSHLDHAPDSRVLQVLRQRVVQLNAREQDEVAALVRDVPHKAQLGVAHARAAAAQQQQLAIHPPARPGRRVSGYYYPTLDPVT